MIWFTSDLHLGHPVVALKHRGFASVEAHDAYLIRRIRKHLSPGETLYILGDVALGGWRETITQLRDVTAKVPTHVVLGNHDRPAPNNSVGHLYVPEFCELGGFASASVMASTTLRGTRVMLSHYPYSNAPGETSNLDEYGEFRLRDQGIPVVHGHTHSKEKFSLSALGTPQVHVGVDAWDYRPVSEREVLELACGKHT